MPPRDAHQSTSDVKARVVQQTARETRKQPAAPHLPGTSVSSPLNINVFASAPAPTLAPPPRARPPFSRADVVAAVPAHCFERSAVRSLGHVAWDFAVIAALGAAATRISGAPAWAQVALWALYWFAQGCVMTGVWVLAHECGHGAFSTSKALNDTVGWVLHSALLVPYHSWRISHAKHHRNTCSVEHDEVFVPPVRSEYGEAVSADTPLGVLWGITVMLLFGWPAYLVSNVTGPAKYGGRAKSHFEPSSALFEDDWASPAARRREIVVSNLGFAAAVAALGAAAWRFGPAAVAAYYLVPYLVVNLNLVLITYLQHTDAAVPHYREPEFDWLRGALSTVDRSYGWLLDATFHHISDTHVVHHMFHEMPFYHAAEATKAIRPLLGDYYLADHTPIPTALWRAWWTCRWVPDKGDVVFYESHANPGASAAAGAAPPASPGRKSNVKQRVD